MGENSVKFTRKKIKERESERERERRGWRGK